MRRKFSGIINVAFDATVRLLIIYSAFAKYLRKWDYNDEVHQLFIDFKKAGESKREEREYQHDASIQMFIIIFICLLSTTVSPCFGHQYAHHQENKYRVLLHMVFVLVVLDVAGCSCGALRCRLRGK